MTAWLEFIGDLALENAIGKYLVARFPTATKGQYNEMKRALVEKQGLKVVSRNLGLSSMLLTFKNTQHIAEDVVESFLGAMAGVSDRLVPGLGDVNVYNYVVWYYNEQDISPEREGQMPPKTIVQQTFEKFFDQKTVKQEEVKVPQGVLVRAVVPQSVVSDMKKIYGKDIPEVLGESVGLTSKAASAKAYQAARDLLNQLGITFEWAERIQREREFNSGDMKKYYDQAIAKARGEGYTELVLLKSSTLAGKEGTLVGLAGVLPNGKKVTVAVGEGAQRFEAALAAMKAYSGL
jgi:dsRNA-specific ribonuclease